MIRFIRHPRLTLRRCRKLRRLRRNRKLATQRRQRLADYDAWFHRRFALSESERRLLQQQLAHEIWLPRISILMTTRNAEPAMLERALESVLNQIYPNWELCIADSASNEQQTRELIRDIASRDTRIRIVLRERAEDPATVLNAAWEQGTGDYFGLLDAHDQLTGDAIYRVWRHLQENRETRIVYGDEDQIDNSGRLHDPLFKPDWSPEYFLSMNYLGRFTVIETRLARQAGGFRCGLDDALEYDLLLRCLAQLSDPPSQIGHVTRILYHRRQTTDPAQVNTNPNGNAADPGLRALSDYSAHLGLQAFAVEADRLPNTYHVRWPLPTPPPLVSLIIPTRDRHDLLAVCVDSIVKKTTYPNYEILIVDNHSTCKKTLALLERYRLDPRIRVLPYSEEFNFSAICNWAVKRQGGSITGLVNNDVQVINADWMTEMVSQCCRPKIGCVGAKLRYGDDTIQHGGVILGLGGTAGHAHHRERADGTGYGGRLVTVSNVAAVTAACLFVRKCVYQQVAGMDEVNLTTAYNDIDLCLKVMEAGYRNVFIPHAELYHYESQTRGLENTRQKKRRFAREAAFIQAKWGYVLAHDPYYNPNLELAPPGRSFDRLFADQQLK